MAAITRRVHARATNIWPGFVDALATLLMVIIFVLMIFIVSQFYLTQLLSGRDKALDQLERQVLELSEMLAMEKTISEQLRIERTQLSIDLQASNTARDDLASRVSSLSRLRDELEEQLITSSSRQAMLQQRIAEIDAERDNLDFRIVQLVNERDALLAKLRAVEEEAHIARVEQDDLAAQLADANRTIQLDQDTIELQLRDLEALRRDIAALEQVRAELEQQVVELVAVRTGLEQQLESTDQQRQLSRADLDEARALLTGLVGKLAEQRARAGELESRIEDRDQRAAERDARIAELAALLSSERDQTRSLQAQIEVSERRTVLAQKEIEDREIRLEELLSSYDLTQRDLTEEQKVSAGLQQRVDALNEQLLALRQQLARIQKLLDDTEAEVEIRDEKIINLTSRLNTALISRVSELQRFRSEFFGRLRDVLRNRRDIRIVNDRFVFQAEVLFASGSAEIGRAGRQELQQLARALNEIAPRIPSNIDWILQVEGHTDSVPISNVQFRNNWDLSAARAISVVEYLIGQGVAPRRLSATGYGEHRPVDPSDGSISERRNRRIEMKLTQR